MLRLELALPAPTQLGPIARGIATLDALLCAELEHRYYSFDRHWGDGARKASMRDGSGDEWFLVFTGPRAFLKGLAHDYPRGDVDAIYAGLPTALDAQRTEPAFSMAWTNYGGWYDDGWTLRCHPDAMRAAVERLAILAGAPETYREYAAEYFERDVPLDVIAHVYAGGPLDDRIVARVSDRTLAELADDLDEIGYPT
ncbi:MAG TPA: hypothetical protein VFQ53_24975 [Kofleriaceae bacterium]|nr:hypothetical protein [Kofleriaceae bacterium]